MEMDAASDARARQSLYHLVGQTYLRELDLERLRQLAAFPAVGEVLPPPGRWPALLEELRSEWVYLFVGNLPPYESVYVDAPSALNTDATDTVVRRYRSLGFLPTSLQGAAAPDHIGLEMEMVAHLAGLEAAAWEAGESARAFDLVRAQEAFLREHLLRWAPVFCLAVERAAASPLYRRIARMTREFLLADHQGLSEMLEQLPS